MLRRAAFARMMDRMMTDSLPEPYASAIQDAIAYIADRYAPTGILVSGSIVRGNPNAASDLDIVVTHPHHWRQRTQRFFNTVPADVFVNPPFALEGAMRRDAESGRPVMAHMLATGTIVRDTDSVMATLQRTARDVLASGPACTAEHLTQQRYAIATGFEDAVDIASIDPELASAFLTDAVLASIRLLFLTAGQWLPRQKLLLSELERLSPAWGRIARDSLRPQPIESRIETAAPLVRHAAGATGFFEWESTPQDVEP